MPVNAMWLFVFAEHLSARPRWANGDSMDSMDSSVTATVIPNENTAVSLETAV
jgi:hypothetical protein